MKWQLASEYLAVVDITEGLCLESDVNLGLGCFIYDLKAFD